MGTVSAVAKKAVKKVGDVHAAAFDPFNVSGRAGAKKGIKAAAGIPFAAKEEKLEREEQKKKDAARALAEEQQRTGTSALASAEDLSRNLASDPTGQISGSVAATDKRSGIFSSLVQGVEQRRAQILQSRRAPGRRSTILTR
jgi:hypothetical protein